MTAISPKFGAIYELSADKKREFYERWREGKRDTGWELKDGLPLPFDYVAELTGDPAFRQGANMGGGYGASKFFTFDVNAFIDPEKPLRFYTNTGSDDFDEYKRIIDAKAGEVAERILERVQSGGEKPSENEILDLLSAADEILDLEAAFNGRKITYIA